MHALHPPIQAALAPEAFNDDDIYVFDAETKELVRSVGRKSLDVYFAKEHGFAVKEGQTWGTGMLVKNLGLWRAA
jgi:hypothetical protein